jgi:uncharacterized membrane protein (UPF0127 family)
MASSAAGQLRNCVESGAGFWMLLQMTFPSKLRLCAAALLAAGCLAGCQQDKSPSQSQSNAAAAASSTSAPNAEAGKTNAASDNPLEIPRAAEGKPQPKLPTLTLWVGTNEVHAEIAQTLPQIMTGMMWRTNMDESDGMLFVFGQPQRVGFWMRNTLLPLSCAYIDPDGTILELHDMQPRDENPITAATDQVQFVLEMKQGWFDRHHVKTGVAIATDRGTLAQTFLRR